MAAVPFSGADEAFPESALINRAAVLCDEGRYAEAEPLLKTVIGVSPADAEAHSRLAIVYLKTDRPAEAAQEYLKTAELDEKLARSLRMINPMFSLSKPAAGIATESGYSAAPAPSEPALQAASDGAAVKNSNTNN